MTNGDMGGGGSKNCHFCGDVPFERPLSSIYPVLFRSKNNIRKLSDLVGADFYDQFFCFDSK